MENGKEEVQKIQQEIKLNADIMGKNLVLTRCHIVPTSGGLVQVRVLQGAMRPGHQP